MRLVEESQAVPQSRVFNKAEIAESFSVTLPTVDAWIRKGCPVMQRGGRGIGWELDIFAVYAWKHDIDEDKIRDEDPESMSPKERLDFYKGCRERDAHRKEKGELIHADELTEAWTKAIGALKAQLFGIPMRLASRLVDTSDLRKIEDMIKDEIHVALDVFSEMRITKD